MDRTVRCGREETVVWRCKQYSIVTDVMVLSFLVHVRRRPGELIVRDEEGVWIESREMINHVTEPATHSGLKEMTFYAYVSMAVWELSQRFVSLVMHLTVTYFPRT